MKGVIRALQQASTIIARCIDEKDVIGVSDNYRKTLSIQTSSVENVEEVAAFYKTEIVVDNERGEGLEYPYQISTTVQDIKFFTLLNEGEYKEWTLRIQHTQA